MAQQSSELRVSKIKRETENAVSISFEIGGEHKELFNYQSGQYLSVETLLNGEKIRRAYSFSSSPFEGNDPTITVKEVEGGRMSGFLCKQVKESDRLQIFQAEGRFVLGNEKSDLLLFAAGSGITPIISILKTALNEAWPNVKLIYCNKSEASTIFKNDLNELAEKYSQFSWQNYLSTEGNRLNSERINEELKLAKESSAHVYVCGPEGMISNVREGAEAQAIPSSQVHFEYFANPESSNANDSVKSETSSTSGSSDPMEVTLVIDDEEFQATMKPNETFLEAGERIGIDPPFSCQSGVCTSCRAKVMSGEVEMENNFGLAQDEIDEGYVLTCIGKPVSAGVVVNWDEA